jgi:hypothetical protein
MAQSSLPLAVEDIRVWKSGHDSRLVRTIKGEFIRRYRSYDCSSFVLVCDSLRKEYEVRECVLETDKLLKKIIEDKNAR